MAPRKKSNPSGVSSVEKVFLIDDLLVAILVLLPVKYIFRSKSVSKRWNNISSDPNFLKQYSDRMRTEQLGGRLLAVIQSRYYRHGPRPQQMINLLPVEKLNELRIKPLPIGSFGTFVNSSDGLILCQENKDYRVISPVTRTWVPFPPPDFSRLHCLGLFCEQNTKTLVPCFRVLGIAMEGHGYLEGKTVDIGTFSSRTGEWTRSTIVCKEELHKANFHRAFVHDGVFHWYIGQCRLAVYDANGKENMLELIMMPRGVEHQPLTLTRSADALWIGMTEPGPVNSITVSFWMLPKDKQDNYQEAYAEKKHDWIMMGTINNESVCRDMILLLESKKKKKSYNIDELVAKAVSNMKLEEFIPGQPVLAVLSVQRKIFLYNIESRSVELVRGRPFQIRQSGFHALMEPQTLSIYGPLPYLYLS